MADAFLNASETYQRARSLGTRSMPLAAGEVAEIVRRRPLAWHVLTVLRFAGCLGFIALIWWLAGFLGATP